jgi:hypothetical protein
MNADGELAMEPLEQKLKRALERQDPPPGFAGRVLARLERRESPGPKRRWAWPEWTLARGWRTALATGLALFMVLGAGLGYRQHQQRLRGEKARAELMLALQITGKQLNRVHRVLVEPSHANQE